MSGLRRPAASGGPPPPAGRLEPAVDGRALRSARSTRRMLHAAYEILAERGCAGLTLQAVGERAGYSRGLPTQRFGSKAGLVAAMLESALERWNEEVLGPRLAGRSGVAALRALIDAWGELARADPAALRSHATLLLEAASPNQPELRRRVAEYHVGLRTQVARLIEAGVRSGELRADLDAEAEAALLAASLRGLAYQWLLDPDGFALDRSLAELERGLERSLGADLPRRRRGSQAQVGRGLGGAEAVRDGDDVSGRKRSGRRRESDKGEDDKGEDR